MTSPPHSSQPTQLPLAISLSHSPPHDDEENVSSPPPPSPHTDAHPSRTSAAKSARRSKKGPSEEEEEKLIPSNSLPSHTTTLELTSFPRPSPAHLSSAPPSTLRTSPSSSLLSQHFRALILDASADTDNEEKAEMLDYDAAEDSAHLSSSSSHSERLTTLFTESLRVLITAVVGVSIGLTGYVISFLVRRLIALHVTMLDHLMTRDLPITAFLFTASFSLAFTLLAALTVAYGSWYVKGSGVGKLNAFLSGVSSARSLTLRTLLFKCVGLVCSVSAGMKQGMEGPFIHVGAMLGLHISHLLLAVLHFILTPLRLTRFSHAISGVGDERMFISGGAAAGFSVAFNAPIAGLLYVQDGASAYWNGDYTFRSFICTMVAVSTINLCYAQSSGTLPSRGLIDLEDQPATNIYIREFSGFFLLGILGGLLGALFTSINLACEKRRLFYLGHKRVIRVLDTLVCSLGGVLLSFALPFLFSCTPVSDQCTLHALRCLRFQCGPFLYSEAATFFYTLPEETIRVLFDRNRTAEAGIEVGVLAVFCVTYFMLAALSYGSAVPGGLFIPSIIIGASYGRIVGIVAANFLPPDSSGIGINPGVYAVLGAASMLGGVTRMTLPISVMMIEITSDAQFLIPIMLVVIVAKVVADQCVGPLYAEHLRMDGLVLMFSDRVPRSLRRMKAREMMNRGGVVKVGVVEAVDRLTQLLRETTHNAFPVVDLDARMRRGRLSRRTLSLQRAVSDVREGEEAAALPGSVGQVFLGLVQRRHLLYALHHPALHAHSALEQQGHSRAPSSGPLTSPQASNVPSLSSLPALSWSSSFPFAPTAGSLLSHPPPTAPTVNGSTPSALLLDLSGYVDEGAYMVSEETPARRVWALFRSLGMRHIVVVDKRHQPVGMITRRDLLAHAIADQ